MMKVVTLAIVSLLIGAIWRAELEIRWGWASMDWIGPFHWAFPVATAIFLLWMWRELRDVAPRTRQIVIGMTAALGLVAYFVGGTAMAWAYNRWIVLLAPWLCLSYRASPVVIYAVLGSVYFTTVTRMLSPSPLRTATGVIGYIAAFPIALFLLWLTDHRGGPDPIHAIKSGFVFPLIAFALGLPILFCPDKR